LTGQFPNQYQRIAPRLGFAWQPLERTVVRGGVGVFYENFDGLNYRNSVITNGLATQQSSVSIFYDPTLAPNQQTVTFPGRLTSGQVFSGSSDTLANISLVDPSLRDPEVLQALLHWFWCIATEKSAAQTESLGRGQKNCGPLWTN
jgi:hypothetical protein